MYKVKGDVSWDIIPCQEEGTDREAGDLLQVYWEGINTLHTAKYK